MLRTICGTSSILLASLICCCLKHPLVETDWLETSMFSYTVDVTFSLHPFAIHLWDLPTTNAFSLRRHGCTFATSAPVCEAISVSKRTLIAIRTRLATSAYQLILPSLRSTSSLSSSEPLSVTADWLRPTGSYWYGSIPSRSEISSSLSSSLYTSSALSELLKLCSSYDNSLHNRLTLVSDFVMSRIKISRHFATLLSNYSLLQASGAPKSTMPVVD